MPVDVETLVRRISDAIDGADQHMKVNALAFCLYGAVQAAYAIDEHETIEMCVKLLNAFRHH
jgi:hypothetical protein